MILRIALAALVMICAAVPAWAAITAADQPYTYTLKTGEDGEVTAVLSDYVGDETVVTVPTYVDGYRVSAISSSLFNDEKTTLKELTISVETIPSYTFRSFTALEKVTIGEGTKYIGNYAFSGCTSLAAVSIGAGVTEIDDCAFYNCKALTSIVLPEGITTLGYYPFSGSGLETLVVPGTLTDVDYRAFTGIESTLKELTISVKVIPDGAFADCTALEKVTIGSGTETVGTTTSASSAEGAFKNCTSLTTVTLSNTLTHIDDSSFYGCVALTGIDIPDSVTSIGSSAFYGCTSLAAANIGAGVTEIDGSAFYNCETLTSIVLPEGIVALGSNVFNGTALETLVVPGTLTDFNANSFDGIESTLKELTISVETIPESAFTNCVALEKVTIGSGTKYIGVSGSSSGAFEGCTSLTTVSLPETLSFIHQRSFYGCTALTGIDIPDAVTYIGISAFYGCTALTGIDIPDAVTYIGNSAFYGCTSLATVNLGAGVNAIGSSAFYNCKALTTAVLPEGVTILGSNAFYGSGLETLVVPGSLRDFTATSFNGIGSTLKELTISVPTIPEAAFDNCAKLETVTIGSGTQYIGTSTTTGSSNGAFRNCTGLTTVTLPDTLTYIDDGTFYGCTALTSIAIPDAVTCIGGSAFYGCTALVTADIGAGVTQIGVKAFYNCEALSAVVLPEGITTLGGSAFYNCKALTSIVLPEGMTTLGINAFYGTSLETLVVPSTLTCAASSVNGLESTLKELTISSKEISDTAFADFTALEKVTIGSGTNYIGNITYASSASGAFKNCTSLTTVTLPDTLTHITYQSFYGCSALTSIDIPDSVISIGPNAFSGCALTRVYLPVGLATCWKSSFPTEITLVCPADSTTAATLTAADRAYVTPTTLALPANLTRIEAEAFVGSDAEMVVVPAGCAAIGSRAFAEMPNLRYVQLPEGAAAAEDAFSGSPVQYFIAP